jgi:hypothetical protein
MFLPIRPKPINPTLFAAKKSSFARARESLGTFGGYSRRRGREPINRHQRRSHLTSGRNEPPQVL